MEDRIVVADNGAFSLRAGFSNEVVPRIVMPNQIATIRNDVSGKELVGEETDSQDAQRLCLEFKRPHQRGCLLDKQVEDKIWTRALSQLFADGQEASQLLVTESPLVPSTCKRLADELFFERFNFSRVGRVLPQSCVALDFQENKSPSVVSIVVDCGYSATWIVPLLGLNPIWPQSLRRIDLGGKALTNLWKEELTWRHVNVMEDTRLVEDCKITTCFVKPAGFKVPEDKSSVIEYLLPDYVHVLKGRVLANNGGEDKPQQAQTMRLSVLERTNIPEVLFNPSRIGLAEGGLVAAIQDCVESLPFELQQVASQNILLTGGSARFSNFSSRLAHDLDLPVQDWSEHYLLSAWRGAAKLAQSKSFPLCSVSRQQYLEEGSQGKRTQQSTSAWWQVENV